MPAISLDALLNAAGASLGEAQSQLLDGVPLAPTRMAMSEATLDMMVTVEGAKGKDLQVAAVNAALARAGTVTPEALSRVTMRFVAMADPAGAAPVTAGAPAGTPGGAPSTSPPAPPAGGGSGPRRPMTRAEMRAEMLKLSEIAPLVRSGANVRVDLVTIGPDRTLAQAFSDTGDVLAVRLLDGAP